MDVVIRWCNVVFWQSLFRLQKIRQVFWIYFLGIAFGKAETLLWCEEVGAGARMMLADGLFQNLQAQLEGTENRITVARSRYISSVQDYNSMIRTFPNNLTAKMFGYQVKPNFSVANEQAISTAPTVDFGNSAPAPAASAH